MKDLHTLKSSTKYPIFFFLFLPVISEKESAIGKHVVAECSKLRGSLGVGA